MEGEELPPLFCNSAKKVEAWRIYVFAKVGKALPPPFLQFGTKKSWGVVHLRLCKGGESTTLFCNSAQKKLRRGASTSLQRWGKLFPLLFCNSAQKKLRRGASTPFLFAIRRKKVAAWCIFFAIRHKKIAAWRIFIFAHLCIFAHLRHLSTFVAHPLIPPSYTNSTGLHSCPGASWHPQWTWKRLFFSFEF